MNIADIFRDVKRKAAADDDVDGSDDHVVKRTRVEGANGADGNDEDDERFYGDGLSTREREILTLLDDGDDAGFAEIEDRTAQGGPRDQGLDIQPSDIEGPNNQLANDVTAVRKLVMRLERASAQNAQDRTRHPDTPLKFAESEADVAQAVHALLLGVTGLDPRLLVDCGGVPALLALLAHDNEDIVAAAVDVLSDLTDDDVHPDQPLKAERGVQAFVSSLLDGQLLELLVANLARFSDATDSVPEPADGQTQDDGRTAIHQTLSLIENLISIDPSTATLITSRTPFLIDWLLPRLRAKPITAISLYASEVLSILLSASPPNLKKLGEDGIETLLVTLNQFKKRDPKSAEEAEFMENIFDCLSFALEEDLCKQFFIDGEGVELCIIMMKENSVSRFRAFKLLSYATSGTSAFAKDVADRFVQSGGLKHLFEIFMKKNWKRISKDYASYFNESDLDEHILSLLLALLRFLPESSPPRLRLVAKFLTSDPAVLAQLISYHITYINKAIKAHQAIEDEKDDIDFDAMDSEDVQSLEENFTLRRLDGGLAVLQIVDRVVMNLVLDKDAGDEILKVLKHDLKHLDRTEEVVGVLDEFADMMSGEGQDAKEQSRMKALVKRLADLFEVAL